MLGDAVEHRLDGDEVLPARVAMPLVLQRVFDLFLKILGDKVPVRDVADPRHRGTEHVNSELNDGNHAVNRGA